MAYIREFIIFITSSFTFLYIVSLFSFDSNYRNFLYYPTPHCADLLGSVGSYIASLSFLIFGKTAYFIVFPLFFIVIGLVFERKKFLIYSRNSFLLLLVLSGFIGLFSKEFYGGLVGGLTGILFKTLFGFVGTLFILLFGTVYVLSLFFENKINVQKIFDFLKSRLNNKKENHSEGEDNIIEVNEYKLYGDSPGNRDSESIENDNLYEKEEKADLNTFPTDSEDCNKSGSLKMETEEKIEETQIDYNKIKENFYNTIENDEHLVQDKISCEMNEDNKKEFKLIDSTKTSIDIENKKSDKDYIKEHFGSVHEETDDFKFPALDLLKDEKVCKEDKGEEKTKIGNKLIEVLKEFNIKASLANIVSGPVVTRYEIIPPKGVKLSKIVSLEDNISLGLASHERIRIEAPVPGKNVVGIEIPNRNRKIILLKEMIASSNFKPESMAIPMALGKDITGRPYYTDIARIPHLLIAGSTGSGKSVCLNSLITTLLYTKRPEELRLILVDPKRVELKLYDDVPHLITPVIKELNDAIDVLNWLVSYMEKRYKILEDSNVRSIGSYNLINKTDKMPHILVIIDEFADLIITGKKDIEEPIVRLAAMARAVGIHLVLATQRPSADIITNLIKANFPGRIAFKVATKLESRIILDVNGAEKLLGKGDMLYASPNSLSIKRLQSPFISEEEVYNVTEFYRKNFRSSYWDIIKEEDKEFSSPTDEPLFNEAVNIVLRDKRASASYLQRRLRIGYNRAARIIEMMEDMGIVSPPYAGKREILVESWEGV